MNRRLYILTLLSSVTCFMLLCILYPPFKLSSSESNKERTSFFGFMDKKRAFATAICNHETIEATMVSIYSLNAGFALSPESKTDIVVLLSDSISLDRKVIQQLERLGVHIIPISMATNKSSCQSTTVLNLWTLIAYQKIVYFSPDIVFENEIKEILNIPIGSAVITDNDDIALLALNPNLKTFNSLKNTPTNVLLSDDTTVVNYRLSIDAISKNAIVFNGPMKPWNFHSYSDSDWKKYYKPNLFYKWRSLHNDLRHFFDPKWKNGTRQRTICDSYLDSRTTTTDLTHFPIKDQFSVMLSTYNPERIQHLSLIIRHLLKSDKVHTVFITWHNPNLEVPDTLYSEIRKRDYGRVKVLSQTFDSLNNRFNPTEELQTDGVYIMDDDIYLDLEDLEFAFSAWQSRKDSVVGHFPRIHTYDPETHEATYRISSEAPYSIILTKSMFIRSDYLFSYTCLLEPELHTTVDNQLNCEDLGFAMMASGISGESPTYVRTQKAIEDFGLKKGISRNTGHMPARTQCISDFISLYWNTKDPLVLSNDAVVPFVSPRIRTGNWNRVKKLI